MFSQKPASSLTIDKIMQDPKWIGSSPSALQWDKNSSTLYFKWNPDQSFADSLYKIDIPDSILRPVKVPIADQYQLMIHNTLTYSLDKSMWTFEKNGNIYFQSNQNSFPIQVTNTLDRESDPVFSFHETSITYIKGDNLFTWNISDGSTTQLTNFTKESTPKTINPNIQESWLKQDQLRELKVLAERKQKKDLSDSLAKINSNRYMPKPLKPIFTEDKNLRNLQICPEGKYITYALAASPHDKNSIVPNYVTESGYTTTIPARTKVGAREGTQDLFLLDKLKDTIIKMDLKGLEGIKNIPEFFKDYPDQYNKMKKDSAVKGLTFLLSYLHLSRVLD
jgi:hypothetical protein